MADSRIWFWSRLQALNTAEINEDKIPNPVPMKSIYIMQIAEV